MEMTENINFILVIILCFVKYYYGFAEETEIHCPNKCKCLPHYSVDCSGNDFEGFPKDMPSWVQNLDLASNRLNDSIAIDLQSYPQLIVLKLKKNSLKTVPVLSFMNLTYLTVSHNRIASFNHDTMQHMPYLKTLDFSSNRISEIKAGAFNKSKNLKVLILSNNNITHIENESFTGLAFLNELKLNRNKLTSIDKEVFVNLSNLRVLELSRNHIREIKGLLFSKLKNLTILKAHSNFIQSLQDGAFYGLQNLLRLELDDNKIRKVLKGWLYGLESLNYLSLSRNAIRHVEGGWEYCQKLTELDLSHNKLPEIELNTLSHLSKLEQLNLNNNEIMSIAEGAFHHTPGLKVLELNSNNISWAFEDSNGVFIGLRKLIKLGLAGNMITSIHQKAFLGLDSLMELDLRGNAILTLQENAFAFLPSLTNIHLNTTSLTCDCHLMWFSLWIHNFPMPAEQVSCSHPRQLKGQLVVNVPPESFLCSPDNSPKPVIMDEPTSRIVQAGSDVMLTCHARSSSETPMTFKWKRNNHQVQEQIVLTGENRQSDLIFANVTTSDSAKYQCVVSNAFGTTYSRKAELSVLVSPVIIKKPVNVTAKAGNTARLECAATGQPPPQIAWKKDGGNEFPAAQERRMHFMHTDPVFFIVNVKPMDTGIYSCTASNTAGTVVANASLTIVESPSFQKDMEKSKVVSAGEAVVMECIPSGSPKPKLEWMKDGSPLVITERHLFSNEEQFLIIMNTVRSDSGVYECIISNSLGSKKGQSVLTILPLYSSSTMSDMTGVILITVVCCAVLTSAIWVIIIIYHTRRTYKCTNSPTLSNSGDNTSDLSACSKDSGAGDSTKAASHEDLLLASNLGRNGEDVSGSIPVPEVSLPLLTTIHSYGNTSSTCVLKDGTVVLPQCQPGLVYNEHARFCPGQSSLLRLYLPSSHQQV